MPLPSSSSSSFSMEPFNDLQDQFYGIIQSLPRTTTSYTGSINTAEVDNYRDGVYLRTVKDYFQSDQVKISAIPTVVEYPARPNGLVDHAFDEFELLGVSCQHSYTVNGQSVIFRDQITGTDQADYVSGVMVPGMVRYFKQSSLVLSGVLDEAVVYPFFVDGNNDPGYNGFIIEPFTLYTGMIRYVHNPLTDRSGIRGSAFLGPDDSENANPMGSSLVGFGNMRNQGSVAEYHTIAPRPFIDSGADMILVKPNGMFVGRTTQRDNDVLSAISCSMLTPWSDQDSGLSFVDILGGTNATSALQLLSQSVPMPGNESVSRPYYALSGYEFGDSLNMEQSRDSLAFAGGWTGDTSYNQASLYGTDSVTFAGYVR